MLTYFLFIRNIGKVENLFILQQDMDIAPAHSARETVTLL